MGQLISYAINGDHAEGYLSIPPAGHGPGLIVVQEWWGLVPHITELADRFAGVGFVALAPDHYHGEQAESPDEAAKLFMALKIATAGRELRGAADYLIGHSAVEGRAVGVVGFCMGGQLALYAAAEYGDRITCAVDFYGIHPNVRIEPSRLQVPVLGHFGTRDTSVSRETVEMLAREVNAAGGSFESHFYEADHAFFNDTRPQVYDARAAGVAWERTIEFLERHLTAPAH